MNKEQAGANISLVINAWMENPLVLASGSKFRLDKLAKYGFSDIRPFTDIPETVELAVSSELAAAGGAPSDYFEVHEGSDISRHVAGAKVNYALEHADVPENALVMAIDTAPIVYQRRKTGEFRPLDQIKVTNLEDAERLIFETFRTVAEGCRVGEEKIAEHETKNIDSLPITAEEKNEMISAFAWTIDPQHIDIYSGISISFAENRDVVEGRCDHARLFSDTIYSHRNDDTAISLLAKEALDLMEDQALHISGCIDYGKREIRELLGIREDRPLLLAPTTKEALYKGFPKYALNEILAKKAAEIMKEETTV